jgi:cobalt-zinc-cadmium efflux system outer membrane protein
VQRQFPDLKIGLTYSRDSDGSKYLGPGAELEIPLFDRNQGGIAAALSARDRARAEFVATLFRLRAEAYEARAQLERARLEVELQEKDVLPLVRRNEALVEQGLSAHEVNVLDRVASQERALRARQAYLESVVRYQRNVVEVETATGTALARPAVVSVPKQQ